MPQLLKKGSVVFIDDHNGVNSGLSTSELRLLLHDVGVVCLDSYFNKVDCC